VKPNEYNRSPAETLRKLEKLNYPLFVKPVRLGSSIGISRVEDEKGLVNALEVALHYDTDAIVEEAVPNLVEVTVPIIGNTEPIPAMPEEPATSGGNFFDFETKYLKGGKGGKKGGAKSGAQGYSHIPARLPEHVNKRCIETALSVYRAIGAEGIARVDLLVDMKAEKVYFNEVNPLPGSLYAHNWIKCGISKAELVEKLIAYAEEAHRLRTSVMRTFPTNYLKQF
jgi:D-alanine-D-alanine ligase